MIFELKKTDSSGVIFKNAADISTTIINAI